MKYFEEGRKRKDSSPFLRDSFNFQRLAGILCRIVEGFLSLFLSLTHTHRLCLILPDQKKKNKTKSKKKLVDFV